MYAMARGRGDEPMPRLYFLFWLAQKTASRTLQDLFGWPEVPDEGEIP
jgi:hypothetical protein